MPSYEYTCGRCGHVLEVYQAVHEAAWRDCPACAEPALRRREAAGGWFGAGAFGGAPLESVRAGSSANGLTGDEPAAR